MYLGHFILREYPFSLTPDAVFWFDEASHRDAMNVLSASLRAGEGFIKFTAEIGPGKTLLPQMLKEPDVAAAGHRSRGVIGIDRILESTPAPPDAHVVHMAAYHGAAGL